MRTIIFAVVVLTLFTSVADAQSIWLEAECASAGSLWNKPTDANASNSRYVVIQPGNNSTASAPTNTAGHITFPFSLSQSGTYRLNARVLGPTANDDSFWVRMDGGSWVMWNNWFTTSWTWRQFPNTFTLSAGSHTLTIAFREDGAQLDKINLTTFTTLPTGLGSTASNLCSGSGGGCTVPPMPSYASLPANSFLPDPFTFLNGTPVRTKADWTCRRAEIATLAQEFEYGYKQNTPYSATSATRTGNTLVVTVTDNGKTISFNASITYPTTGVAPYPAMIGVGGSSLNNSALSSLGVAVINFPNSEIAQQTNQSSRGVGKFYDMYGSGHSAGALMAWAWGISRLIDAIEKTPAANIDPTRLGVTGCSRNGKGALAAGAFDERIKLTIPQESGSGGSGSWRVSDWMLSQGQTTQTLSQIVNENVWFRANFNQFSTTANKLPFDHHSIIGLVAPRAILIIDNDILWLGPQSSWSAANAARGIWQALGVFDTMGYSLTTGHTHCAFPSSQQAEVNAYVQKFLIGGGTGNTNVMRNDIGVTFNEAMWINWTVPAF